METVSLRDGRRPVLGVMGAGYAALADDVELSERLGELAARAGWAVLTGGRGSGVMSGACRGARRVPGSLTIGILPSPDDGDVSAYLDVAVFTGLGSARNAVNVISSDVVVACGRGGPGTAAEVALAIKAGRPVVLLSPEPGAAAYFATLDPDLAVTGSAEEALAAATALLARGRGPGCRSRSCPE